MSTRLSGELMRRYACELRGLTVRPARAAELARDVQRARDAARAVAAFNDFNDEPACFAAMLSERQHAIRRR